MSMKKWIVLFMAAIFCISMVGCAGTADGQNKNDAGTETGGGQNTEDMTADVVPDQQDSVQSGNDGAGQPEEYENDTWYVKDGQITGLNEQIEKDGCIWTISSIEVTKKRGDRQESDFNYWDEEMDADGTLTGAESYLFVTVSCKNSGDQTQEVLLNSNGFVTICIRPFQSARSVRLSGRLLHTRYHFHSLPPPGACGQSPAHDPLFERQRKAR